MKPSNSLLLLYFFGLPFFIQNNSYAQPIYMDLVVKSDGDSIACRIDSVTEEKVYFIVKTSEKWSNTWSYKEDLSYYGFNEIYKRYARFKKGTTIIEKYQIKKKARTWLGISIGANHFESPCVGIDINHQIKRNLFSLRYMYGQREEIEILSSEPPLYLHDFGFLYGICTQTEKFNISASIGVGSVAYNDRIRIITEEIYYVNKVEFNRTVIRYETPNHFIIGIPMELQMSYFREKKGGIGLKTFANINKEHSVLGVALVVTIGRLRWY